MAKKETKTEVFGMPYNKELSEKYGVHIYDYHDGSHYVLEFGEWFTEEEMNSKEFEERKELYFCYAERMGRNAE